MDIPKQIKCSFAFTNFIDAEYVFTLHANVTSNALESLDVNIFRNISCSYLYSEISELNQDL